MEISKASSESKLIALFDAHADGVYTVARRLVPTAADAEDIVQETFIRALLNLHELRDPQAAGGWLYRIAYRLSIDLLRRPASRPTTDLKEVDVVDHDLTGDPERQAVLSDLRQRLLEALTRLPPQDRAAFVLRDGEQLSMAETASVMGCSLSAAKMRVHRARRQLRELLDREFFDAL